MSREITLCVLAGGEAKRMGRAKAELQIDGKPILSHLLDRLHWDGPTMLVTAPGREHPPTSERFDCEVIDPVSGAGPLRGLLTALENLKTDRAIVITVDMPLIDREMLDWLIAHLDESIAAMTRDQPFPSIYRKVAAPIIRRKLEQNSSMFALFDEPGFATLAAPASWSKTVWTNLNTPADLTGLRIE